MTHDEWWETQDLSKVKNCEWGCKELTKKAWCASRDCPVRDSGDDTKTYYCPKCGGSK